MRIHLGAIALLVLLACVVQAEDTKSTCGVQDEINKLADKDSDVRADAARELSKLGSGAQAAVPALTKALKDTDEDVRDYAAEALGKIGEDASSAVPALTDLLKDSNASVRTSAAE